MRGADIVVAACGRTEMVKVCSVSPLAFVFAWPGLSRSSSGNPLVPIVSVAVVDYLHGFCLFVCFGWLAQLEGVFIGVGLGWPQ